MHCFARLNRDVFVSFDSTYATFKGMHDVRARYGCTALKGRQTEQANLSARAQNQQQEGSKDKPSRYHILCQAQDMAMTLKKAAFM
jgi:hypothetical protein